MDDKTEFTLKNVVDFMEANGFHVSAAHEEDNKEMGCIKPLDSDTRAIRLRITPKAAKHSQISFR